MLSTITVRGIVNKVIVTNEDEGAIIVIKNEVDTENGVVDEDINLVVNRRMWARKKDSIRPSSKIKVIGRLQIFKDSRCIQNITVFVNELKIYKLKQWKKEEQQIHREAIKQEVKQVKGLEWYSLLGEDKFVSMESDEIELVEDIHTRAKKITINLDKERLDRLFIAVRKNEGGKYALVRGIRSYVTAKVYGCKVKAYITDLKHGELEKKLNEIEEERVKNCSKQRI